MRIPSSYLPTGPEDGSAVYNDGKVGVAYIQEYRFAKYVERLQKQIQEDLDREFKMFLKYKGVEIDSSSFYLEFNKPLNFSSYREIQLETERAQLFAQVQAIPFLSNQFKLKKYLGLSESEIKENEELWRQENNVDNYSAVDTESDVPGLNNIGLRPNPDEEVDLDAEPDLTDIEAPEDDLAGLGGEQPPAGGEPQL